MGNWRAITPAESCDADAVQSVWSALVSDMVFLSVLVVSFVLFLDTNLLR